MKTAAALILAFNWTLSAEASLSDEFANRQRSSAATATAMDQARKAGYALRSAERAGKSRAVSGPEIRLVGGSQDWYYQLANGKICVVPVSLDSAGNILVVWGASIACQ